MTRPKRGRSRQRRGSTLWVVGAAALAVVVLVAIVLIRSGGSEGPTVAAGEPIAHVHGLGVNPADGALYAATHYGLFRLDEDGTAERVGESVQDTMGFTVVGPNHFLASGHPDPEDDRLRRPFTPPLLGLIESTNAGRTWDPVSLLGEADFHALVAAHGLVYGYDSTSGRLMVSPDGEEWSTRSEMPIIDFAVDPDDRDHLVAATPQGVVESADGGRSWEPLGAGPPLVFLSWHETEGLWGVGPDGMVYERGLEDWQRHERLPGAPQAFLVTDDVTYAAAAVDSATRIYASTDGARTWRVLYADPQA